MWGIQSQCFLSVFPAVAVAKKEGETDVTRVEQLKDKTAKCCT